MRLLSSLWYHFKELMKKNPSKTLGKLAVHGRRSKDAIVTTINSIIVGTHTHGHPSLGMEQMYTHLTWEVRGEALRKELYSYDFVTLRFLLT